MRGKLPLPLVFILPASLIGTMAFRISVPAVAFYVRIALSATALSVGLLTSAFFVGRALSSALTGKFSISYRRNLAYLGSTAFALDGILVYLYSLMYSPLPIIFLRFFHGVLNGAGWVSLQYLLGTSVDKRIRGRIFSIYFILGSFGGILGNYMYSLIAYWSLENILLLSSALYLITSLLSLLSFNSSKFIIAKAQVVKENGKLLRQPDKGYGLREAVPLFLLLFAFGVIASGLRGDLIYIYIKEVFRLSKSRVALFLTAAGLVALAGNYILSWAADTFGNKKGFQLSFIVTLLGIFLIPFQKLPAAITGLMLFYVGSSALMTISRSSAITHFTKGGLVIGLVNASGNLGNMAGGAFMGVLYEKLFTKTLVVQAPINAYMMVAIITFLAISIPPLLKLIKTLPTTSYT